MIAKVITMANILCSRHFIPVVVVCGPIVFIDALLRVQNIHVFRYQALISFSFPNPTEQEFNQPFLM